MFRVLLLTLQMFGTPSMAHVLMCLLIPESKESQHLDTMTAFQSHHDVVSQNPTCTAKKKGANSNVIFEYYPNTKPLPLQGRFLLLSVMDLFTTQLLCLYLYFPECKP